MASCLGFSSHSGRASGGWGWPVVGRAVGESPSAGHGEPWLSAEGAVASGRPPARAADNARLAQEDGNKQARIFLFSFKTKVRVADLRIF